MKTFLSLAAATFVAGMLLIPRTAAASFTFEGVITFNATHDGVPSAVTYSIKGEQLRIDVQSAGGAGVILMNGKTHIMTTMLPSRKMYMEQPMAMTNVQSERDNPMPSNTGKVDTVLGHLCQIWEGKNLDGTEVRLWLATDVPAFFGMPGSRPVKGNGESLVASFIRQHSVFPMRMTQTRNNVEVSRMEVTKIDAKPVDIGLLTVPADYTKMDMHNLGR